ncbi:hypothetical protein D3Z50_09485 [Clostridiaceae bacterium]|nr:hypothetical protein [Clostridiaceae bacterium]
MANINDNRTIKINLLISAAGQVFIMLLGLLIPRIMIGGYGSDVNGLVSTIGQMFTYVNLLEAGISQSARNMLYKPIAENDRASVNHVLSLAQKDYNRFTILYIIGVVLLSFSSPFLINTNIDQRTIFLIVVFEGMAGAVSFFFTETDIALLTADGKGYINNGINFVSKMIGYFARIILAVNGVNVVILQITYFFISILKALLYRAYRKKKYPWVNIDKACHEALPDRNAYVITETAWVVFSSTDMIVLSMFIDTAASSVYSLYNLIFTNISSLMSTVYFSVAYLLGQTYFKSMDDYARMHDSFNSVFVGIMTIMMCVCSFMAIPFIRLYTNGVADIEYVYPSLPAMFCAVQLLSWSRYVAGNLTGIAGYAKKTSGISLIEAFANVGLSVLLVKKYGLFGVLFATVIVLPIKIIYCNYISDKVVMKRSSKKTLAILGINAALFITSVLASRVLSFEPAGYRQFFMLCICLFFLYGLAGLAANIIVNRDMIYTIRKLFLSKGD